MNIGAGDRNRTGDVHLGKLAVSRCAVRLGGRIEGLPVARRDVLFPCEAGESRRGRDRFGYPPTAPRQTGSLNGRSFALADCAMEPTPLVVTGHGTVDHAGSNPQGDSPPFAAPCRSAAQCTGGPPKNLAGEYFDGAPSERASPRGDRHNPERSAHASPVVSRLPCVSTGPGGPPPSPAAAPRPRSAGSTPTTRRRGRCPRRDSRAGSGKPFRDGSRARRPSGCLTLSWGGQGGNGTRAAVARRTPPSPPPPPLGVA
jgi:hypothetical protein